jgi:colanic acid/amylovoran biosynthesis glycosyltransferase
LPDPGHILYVGAVLPKCSETFVFRELLALRETGLRVSAATLRPPEYDLGDPRLDALADEAVPVYGAGPARLVGDALRALCQSPGRALAALAMAARDTAIGGSYWRERVKVPAQVVAGLALAARVRRRAVTHLHAHMAHAPASVAMYAARALGVPFSFTGHAADLFRDRALLAEKLRRAAFVACISLWHRRWYQEQCPRPDTDYPLVRCGVDPTAYTPASPQPPGTPLRLIAIGRLVPKKGFDILLRALPALADLNLHLRLVGEGPEAARLAALVRELALESRVHLAGRANPGDVPALLQQADLFVLPCRTDAGGDRDGIPVVLMEAMAARVGVISGDLPTLRELVEHDVTGLLVPPDDPDALAAAIRRLAGDPALRHRLQLAAHTRIEKEFSLRANAASIRFAFEQVREKETNGG